MNTALKGCLLLAIAAAPAFAQTSEDQRASNVMNCPMMSDQMQKQMSTMMTEMRTMMEGTSDPAIKSRMQTMREHMSAMMTNMQRMRRGMMGAAPGEAPKAEGAPTPAPDARKQNHEEHHPAP